MRNYKSSLPGLKKAETKEDLGMRLHGHWKLADLQKGMVE